MKEKQIQLIGGIVILLIISLIVFKYISSKSLVSKEFDITYAETTEKKIVSHQPIIYYQYMVNHKKYLGKIEPVNKKVKVPGGYYVVVYNKENPKINTILINKPLKSPKAMKNFSKEDITEKEITNALIYSNSKARLLK